MVGDGSDGRSEALHVVHFALMLFRSLISDDLEDSISSSHSLANKLFMLCKKGGG